MLHRRSLIFLAVLLLSPICLCVATLGYIFAYNHIGRITDFRDVYGGFTIPNTDYMLHVTPLSPSSPDSQSVDTYEITLENLFTQRNFVLIKWTDCIAIACLPDFAVFRLEDKTYFILKRRSQGSAGGAIYTTFNLSGSEPKVMGRPNKDNILITDFTSCVYPHLAGDELHFESAFDCDAYPFLVDEQFFETMKLT